MTRKISIIIIAIFLVITIATRVNAEETTTTSAKTTTADTTKLKLEKQLILEQKKETINTVKEEARTQMQTVREEFRTRLQTIKDQKKKALVERIDIKIASINKNLTSKYSEVLTKLQGFLERLNKSTTDQNILTNITTTQSSIDAAKAAVAVQAEKTYTMTVTDDLSLRQNAEIIVNQFKQDITAVHKLIIDTKQAMQKLQTEKNIIKKEATSSANL